MTPPAETSAGRNRSSGAPFSVAPMSAPVSATTAALRKRTRGPVSVHSRPAADGGLPTSRLARRNDSASIGPDGGTPTCQ
jgi:hypothetical protein